MIGIDLCKLRPGDIVFTSERTCRSALIRLLTVGRFSHAMLVIYPDLWFQTDGAGSGYYVLDQTRAVRLPNGTLALVTGIPFSKLSILRLAQPPTLANLLSQIGNSIGLTYPAPIEFLPLSLPARCLPIAWVDWLMLKLRGENVGPDYCSRLVSRALADLLPNMRAAQDHHITPSSLHRFLSSENRSTDVTQMVLTNGSPMNRDPRETGLFSNVLQVDRRLARYQYPHSRESFSAALAMLFAELGITASPSDYYAHLPDLQRALTKQSHFRLHNWYWNSRFS